MIQIETRHVSRFFGRVQALDDVSLFFEPGRIHGIIGPEGAGKTTLIRTLLGLLDCQSGEILYQRNGEGASYSCSRWFGVYARKAESLWGFVGHGAPQVFRDLYGISPQQFSEKTEILLHLTRLDKFIDRPAGKLSGGMYKKLGLMCALLRSPEMVLLDEPTNGVDPISRREFWDLLYKLSLEQKITVLMATAYMDEAERCTKVHLLENGKVLACGEPASLLKNTMFRILMSCLSGKRSFYERAYIPFTASCRGPGS